MGNLNLKEIILFDGEVIDSQIEGNAYTDSSDPISKLFGGLIRIIFAIFGIKLKTYVVLTNRRIILVEKRTVLWGIIPSDKRVLTLNKASIQTVGYTQAIRWFVFKTVYFEMANMVTGLRLTYKGKLDEVAKFAEKVSELVAK